MIIRYQLHEAADEQWQVLFYFIISLDSAMVAWDDAGMEVIVSE